MQVRFHCFCSNSLFQKHYLPIISKTLILNKKKTLFTNNICCLFLYILDEFLVLHGCNFQYYQTQTVQILICYSMILISNISTPRLLSATSLFPLQIYPTSSQLVSNVCFVGVWKKTEVTCLVQTKKIINNFIELHLTCDNDYGMFGQK